MNGLTFVPLGGLFFLLLFGYLNRGYRIRLLEGAIRQRDQRIRALEDDARHWEWIVGPRAEHRNSAQ